MKRLTLAYIAILALSAVCHAEGTRQVAPNAAVVVDGNPSTDIAALHMGNPSFNNFATYGNEDPNSRLYLHIADPANECVYLGFSLGHRNVTSPNPTTIGYEYRVKDPDGNIVFGPVVVQPAQANINSWLEAFTGPEQLNGTDGYDAMEITSADLMSGGWTGKGDYYVEFSTVSGATDFLIDFWDLTVVDCSNTTPEEKPGRIWAFNWSIFAINDFGFPNRPFNGQFFVCAPDPENPDAAFVTKIDFDGSGFRPAAFNIAFNSFGSMNTGNVMEDRRSVENMNSTQAEYAVFLNDPVDICETGITGEIELIGVSRCSPDDFCIQVIASKEGQVDLLLDFDGADDIYTPGTADIMIAVNIAADQIGVPVCIDWDGMDGLGNVLAESVGSMIPVLVSYAQGIYHFPVFDAELMTAGFSVEAVRPPAPVPLLYYDDSNITVPSGSGEPAMQLTGCILPCHRWTNFTNNAVPGFGNLHTINSWWFSQQVVREEIFPLPAYLQCEVSGPSEICAGGTAELTVQLQTLPEDAETPEMIAYQWTGPGISGPLDGQMIAIQSAGMYTVEVSWTSLEGGDTCQTACTYEVVEKPTTMGSIDTLVIFGDTVEINGVPYTEGGEYFQTLTGANGCDSLLQITVIILNTVVHFDLNACVSNVFDGTNFDYSEFTPSYPQPVSCAEMEASIIFRDNPESNAHSCTPGVNNSTAMCVSSAADCTYEPGSDKSVLFELLISPAADTAVAITAFSFFEKAPEMFDWVDGDSGPNNYPTLYGLRILKDGSEIFRVDDAVTTTDWTEERYDFSGLEDFVITQPTTFRFELLGFCLIGNGANVAAWDIDEVSVQASCVSPSSVQGLIAGDVRTAWGIPMNDVIMSLDDGSTQSVTYAESVFGEGYQFDRVRFGQGYTVDAARDGDDAAGISTLDLLKLQRHLLGMETFEHPWQYIAGDVNASNSLSAADLLQIRKLLLGIYHEFPHSASWKFGPSVQPWDVNDPWSFHESLVIENLQSNLTSADFLGIKIGDVNGSVMESIAEPSPDDPDIHIHVRRTFLPSGIVRFDFISAMDETLHGLQLDLGVTGGNVIDVKSGVIDLEGSHAAIEQLRVIWISEHGHDVEQGDVLFSALVAPSAQSLPMITVARTELRSEAYFAEGDHEIRSVKLEMIAQEDHARQLLIMPNPFRNKTMVRFESGKDGHAILTMFDVTGRLLHSEAIKVSAGINEITIDAHELRIDQGLVICQLQMDGALSTGKVILQN